jgi:hypothetical protein
MFVLAVSSRCPRTASTVVRESETRFRWSLAAIQIVLGRDAFEIDISHRRHAKSIQMNINLAQANKRRYSNLHEEAR